MSTRIYDAFEFVGDLDALMDKLVEWRKRHFKYAIQWAKNTLDCSDTTSVTQELLRRFSSDLEIDEDCGVSLSVIPYKGRIFVKAFGSQAGWLTNKILWKDPDFKDFHYQNQSDRAEGITDDEWDERERVWDAIFDSRGNSFQHAGLSYDIFKKANCYLLAYELCRKTVGG